VRQALFGDFWLEGELSLLFSDTGRGKSTLAVQIAESLARGVPLAPMEAVPPAQKVLYFDFEMSEKQFAARYSQETSPPTSAEASDEGGSLSPHYQFSDNFLRAQAAPHDELPYDYKNLTEFVQYSFTELLRETEARVVIVDNITFLKGANQNPAAAAQLMKALKHIKQYYGISILVLAHTPKRAFTAPLSINDLQGSNMLSNFADNVFALGGSFQDPGLRYLKHIKHRNTGVRYNGSNIVLYRLVKNDCFLKFEFAGFGRESEHLEWRFKTTKEQRGELKAQAHRLLLLGKTQREIASRLAVSPSTVSRYLEAL
jgi:predicted ATP-dependent serine protease